jgi:peptide-methionine (S)-S-oxide reductase
VTRHDFVRLTEIQRSSIYDIERKSKIINRDTILTLTNGEDIMEKATFGAGCFWHVEEAFRHLGGVLSTTVGYTGGTTKNPTYEEVCTDKTGHVEVVEITYDPQKITYAELLHVFWDIHDPTTKNRQGPDIGTQYRSAIFYHSPEQKTAAELSKETLENAKKYKKKIVTEITQATTFYPAEEYHQRYFEKHGIAACPR